MSDPLFKEWVCQGGFVGSNIQLNKFAVKITCPTFNLNGNPKGALSLLNSNSFGLIRMVGKNVCHGFVFDENDANALSKNKHAGLDLMIDGLKLYCRKKPQGKAMHDILAALMFLNPEYGEWVDGTPFREKGCWGFKKEGSVKALIWFDKEASLNSLSY
jgi:pyrimidine-specific ribonucleoside hydrolase